ELLEGFTRILAVLLELRRLDHQATGLLDRHPHVAVFCLGQQQLVIDQAAEHRGRLDKAVDDCRIHRRALLTQLLAHHLHLVLKLPRTDLDTIDLSYRATTCRRAGEIAIETGDDERNGKQHQQHDTDRSFDKTSELLHVTLRLPHMASNEPCEES